MRVALLGGNGFIGPHVAEALRAHEHEVTQLSRQSGVDRADVARVRAAVEGCDALIDVIAYEPASTQNLLDALAGWRGRYVLISSADVYRNYGGLQKLEDAPPVVAPLTEDAPLRVSRYPYRQTTPRAADDPKAWQDSYDKILVEDAVRAARPDAAIARLPMVYGPGDRNTRFAWITRAMRAGADIEAPAAWLDWRTSYGHVSDVGAAIAFIATEPQAGGETFNAGPETSPTHRDWIERFAALTGWRGEVRAAEDGPFAAAIAGLDLRFPLALDTGKLRALGFREAADETARIRALLAGESL